MQESQAVFIFDAIGGPPSGAARLTQRSGGAEQLRSLPGVALRDHDAGDSSQAFGKAGLVTHLLLYGQSLLEQAYRLRAIAPMQHCIS